MTYTCIKGTIVTRLEYSYGRRRLSTWNMVREGACQRPVQVYPWENSRLAGNPWVQVMMFEHHGINLKIGHVSI